MALSAAWAARVGAAAISLVMSGVMSGVMVALNGGFGPQFLTAWPTAWLTGFLVSFPAASLVVPPVVRWASRLRTGPATSGPLRDEAGMHHKTTISDTADICTLLNTFDAKPQMQQAIVDSLRRFTVEVARQQGFIAASIHASLDGERVVNYVQWETRENLVAMLQTEAARRHLEEVRAFAENVTPVFYRVAFVGAGAHAEP